MSKQLLSAAVDAAATEAEWEALLQATQEDPAIKAEWSRIWEWRDVRDGVALNADSGFCSGVMAAIAQEAAQPETPRDNVLPFTPRKAAPTPAAAPAAAPARAPRRWGSLIPLSAAAGVVAAVLVVGSYQNLKRDAEPALLAEATAEAPVATTVAFNPAEPVVLADDAKAAILNAYLMEHSNSVADRSMGGTLANARFAARTANYRPDAP